MGRTRLTAVKRESDPVQGVSDAIVIAELRASAAVQIAALAGCWILDADQYGGDMRRALELRHTELVTGQHILASLHAVARRLAIHAHANRRQQRLYRRLVDDLDLARQIAASASLGLLRSVITAALSGPRTPLHGTPRVTLTPPTPMLALVRHTPPPSQPQPRRVA
jgi:hypothetical protein